MIPVISKSKWIKWCVKQGIDLSDAVFALDTCYLGTGVRSRPGTLIVTKTALIHHSYSWTETVWAMFEKTTRLEIPLGKIRIVTKRKVSPLVDFLQLMPESHFSVRTDDMTEFDLVLQRDGKALEFVLTEREVNLVVE